MASGGRRFCENCGAQVGDASNFCPSCGAAQSPDPGVPTGPPPTTPEAGRIETPNVANIPPAPSAGAPSAGKKKMSRKTFWITVLSTIIVIVLIARAGGDGGGGSNASGDGPGAGQNFTIDNYAELATDPRSFRGATVDVTGRLLANPEVSGSTTNFQMFADPENNEWNTIVRTDSPPDNLTSGDTVRVQGTVRGAREGENKMGGTVRATEVDAESVEMVEESRTKSR